MNVFMMFTVEIHFNFVNPIRHEVTERLKCNSATPSPKFTLAPFIRFLLTSTTAPSRHCGPAERGVLCEVESHRNELTESRQKCWQH